MAEIVCHIYNSHLTRPTSLHYLVKQCSKFYITLELLQSDCSDLVLEWRGHTVATIFLFRGHWQTCTGCPRTSSFVLQQDSAPARREHNIVAPGGRETRETRRRRALVSVYISSMNSDNWSALFTKGRHNNKINKRSK